MSEPFGDRYILTSGGSDLDRLRLLGEIHDPATHSALARAGLRPGMRYAEFACGIGSVARHAARLGARVTAMDLSEAHLAEASRLAEEEGLAGIEFKTGNIYEPDLPAGSFDFAYCRWILVHLTRPVDALRAIREVLAPGGTIVCEEPDISAAIAAPDTPAHAQFRQYALDAAAARGVNYSGGRLLQHWLRDAGYEVVHGSAYTNQYLNGPHKPFWTWTYANSVPSSVELGVITREAADEILAGLDAADRDPGIWVSHARNHQVIARKPA